MPMSIQPATPALPTDSAALRDSVKRELALDSARAAHRDMAGLSHTVAIEGPSPPGSVATVLYVGAALALVVIFVGAVAVRRWRAWRAR
jgi:hypothetical protein